MNALSDLLNLPKDEKISRGLLHTPAEIAQQPDTWQSTFELFRGRQAEINEFLLSAGLSAPPGSKPTVFLVGAGTSDYIGQSLAYLLRRMWGCEVIAVPSTDLLTHFDELLVPESRYLWISFSRSGDSPEGVAGLERALKSRPDIHHLVVSCNAKGRMVRESAGRPRALSVCLNDAVNDRGLAMTSSFSNMVVFGQCLAHVEDLGRYEPVLFRLVEAGRNLLAKAADCAAALANQPYTKACFVGSGPLRAVAKESALKLLELTAGKMLTMSESALGLRHGPMAALDENTLFVCFLSGDRRVQQYEADLLNEIGNKRLVRTRIAVGGTEGWATNSIAEHFLGPAMSPAVADDYRPAVDVMFGQLLGLFFSLHWQLRPDCPSPNGAISRVVQNVSIHD
ncbi:MAG: SIS domain-containing protein [Acidobacteriia bacterium]|nr:SIS domain-containing protein [Terriglobia bacterium]